MTKRREFRLPDDTDKKLRELAKARNKTLKSLIMDLIEQASTQPEILAQEQNRYQWLDDACPGVVYLHQDDDAKEGFYCVRRAPQQKKLGDGSPTDAQKICQACQDIKGILTDNQTLKKQLDKGFTVRIPFCVNGGKLSEDLQKIWCPTTTAWRPVTKCKNLKNGANCHHLRWIQADARRPQTSDKNRR